MNKKLKVAVNLELRKDGVRQPNQELAFFSDAGLALQLDHGVTYVDTLDEALAVRDKVVNLAKDLASRLKPNARECPLTTASYPSKADLETAGADGMNTYICSNEAMWPFAMTLIVRFEQ